MQLSDALKAFAKLFAWENVLREPKTKIARAKGQTVFIPLKLQTNLREHWRQTIVRKKRERETAFLFCSSIKLPKLPVVITLRRLGKRKCDDDAIPIAFKYVRDGVADAFGVDDGNEGYTWRYDQRIEKEYGVEIEIIGRAT